jgi:nitrogen permease regulator 2-like protein
MALTIAGCIKQPSFATLFELYCSLRQGKTLKQWILENRLALAGLDVRRFISFGVIKGFLYRVHRYPVLIESSNGEKKTVDKRKQLVKYNPSFHDPSVPSDIRNLDGKKHMDALCTMLECSMQDVEDQLAEMEHIQVIWR